LNGFLPLRFNFTNKFDRLENGSPGAPSCEPSRPELQITDTTTNYAIQKHNDKDFLYQKYSVEGANLASIAKLTGASNATLKARVKSFGLERQDNGPRLHGQVPYGWRLFKGKLVEHLGEQKIIAELTARRADGDSFGNLVDWLNVHGVKTKNGAERWDRLTVYKILKRHLGSQAG
jgi:hypothetical protein